MVLGISYQTLIAYLFIFILAIVFIAILATPIRAVFKLLINSAVGAVALIIFNFIGQYINFTVGINPGSILTVGILGAPGFALLIFLRYYLF